MFHVTFSSNYKTQNQYKTETYHYIKSEDFIVLQNIELSMLSGD